MKKKFWPLLLIYLISLSGCFGSGASWNWAHPDPVYAERQRQHDIDFCEQQTSEISSRGPFQSGGARPYGGWGDFIFELCMEERGWVLVQHKGDKGSEENGH